VDRFRRGRPLFAALFAGLLLLLSGCNNPFKPADPEPPSGAGVDENFSSIDDLLNTMSAAIQARSTNGANAYIRAFAESLTTTDRAFRAYHDQDVKATWLRTSNGQPAPEPWLIGNERGVYSELSRQRPNDAYALNWTVYGAADYEVAPDVWAVGRKYQLYAIPDPQNPDQQVLIVTGFADMLLQKVGSRFSIFEWRDRVDPDYGVNPSGGPYSFTRIRLDSQ